MQCREEDPELDPDAQIDIPASLTQGPGTDLLATYWPAAFAAVLVAGGVVLTVRAARRSQARRSRRAASVGSWSFGTALMLVVALGLGANAWVGYFPSVTALSRWVDDKVREPVTEFPAAAVTAGSAAAPLAADGERVTTSTKGYAFLASVPSTSEKVPDAGAWVYLPPDYDRADNTSRYPVMYALHGAPGTAADWFAGGRIDATLDTLISTGKIPPIIVISPDLNAGTEKVDDEPLDRPGGAQLETFVSRDVVGWADAKFRTQADPSHRVIGGMSSGGLGSLLYGLHSPQIFGGVLSIMPYTTPYTASVVADPQSRAHNTPLEVIAARSAPGTQKIFLGQGDGEPTSEATQIRDALRAKGEVTTLRVLPGLGHNWTAARTIAPYGLVWLAGQLGWNAKS